LPVALLYPVLFFTFQTFALIYISSSIAGVIQATVPISTIILAYLFLQEKTSRLQRIGVCLSVSGILIITIFSSKGANFSLFGIFLSLISIISFAGYTILTKKLTKIYSAYTLTFTMITISFITFNIIAIGNSLIEGNISTFLTPLQDASFLLGIIYLGVLSSFVTSLLSTYALSKLDASKVSVFGNLTHIITILVGVLVLDEPFSPIYLLGIIITLAGVIATNYFGQRRFIK
ncbi:MAG: DMT family transporter, partial [Bacilli bacterium]